MSTTGGFAQVVYVDKDLTLRGGYTTTNWSTPDPLANKTTLDAKQQGRVLAVIGPAIVAVEGLHLTGGDATGQPVGDLGVSGGGAFVMSATVAFKDCTIEGNIANTAGVGNGGGLYAYTSTITISDCSVLSNTASTTGQGWGGGIVLYDV